MGKGGDKPSADLGAAIQAVAANPSDAERWDRVEALTDAEQQPDAVAVLFRDVLAKDLDPAVATEIGERAVRFFETWYGEQGSELTSLLERVLALAPGATVVFERLTVAYTVAERWKELLALYDRAIAGATDTAVRARLLEEAAQAAKDFASEPDRAIGYMEQLFALDPSNTALGVSLERLLEKQERWPELITLWESRLERQGAKNARDARLRIAETCADKLGDYARALVQAREVLNEAPDHKGALALLERVVGASGAGAGERRDALALLKDHFTKKGKARDVVRMLEAGVELASAGERREILRELVERLVDLGDDAGASKHQAALLVLEPMPKEQDALRALAERTRDWTSYADALVRAAEGTTHPATTVLLLVDAARTREELLGDEPGALALYERVFGLEAAAETRLEAGRRLARLLEAAGRERELLEVVAALSDLEPEASARRVALAKSARLATKLGETERAERAWRACVESEPHDVEALDALVASAEARKDWKTLADLLARRCEAPGAADRRREDWARLARLFADHLGQLDRAIGVWRKLLDTYGEDRETVSALADLLARAERWQDLTEVLQNAAGHETTRFTELQTKLGDVYRERLGRAEDAAQRYRAALQADPKHAAARAGLRALVDDEKARAIAIDALAEAFTQSGEWKGTLELLEARLSIESEPERKAEILLEAAVLFEEDAKKPKEALECLRRAFAFVPEDRPTEREIRRLAEQLGAWDAVVGAYRDTIARFEHPTPRVAELRHDEGRTLELRLGDTKSALEAYAKATAIAPDRVDHAEAATRIAASLGRWEEATGHAVTCMAARGGVEEKLLAVLEEKARVLGWDALVTGMGGVLQKERDAIPAPVARALWSRVAGWQIEQRSNQAGGEAALVRAVAAEPGHVETLERLAALRRAKPGTPLVETLLDLADARPDDLAPLREAAEVAVAHLDDKVRVGTILGRYFEAAASRVARGEGGDAAAAHLAWVSDTLAAHHRGLGEHARARELLLRTARLDPRRARALRSQAARLAREQGEPGVAIELYRDLLQSDPADREVMAALGELYAETDRLSELAELRRAELAVEPDEERKLAIRIDLARVIGELEARGGRLDVLRENLRARAGHVPSIEALGAVLRERGRHAELAELLVEQARALGGSDADRVRSLVRAAAMVWERDVADADRAIDTYRELHRLEPEGDATAALARLFAGRGQHVEAARWLELRMKTAPPDLRPLTAVDLGRAHLEGGQREKARACLEEALAADGSLSEARTLLADVYRREAAWQPLAGLLEEGARRERDDARRLAQLREVARLHFEVLHEPAHAVGALEQAVALRPDDQGLALRLAESLGAARRHDEARRVLTELLESFGRKRTPERADVHYQLARVEEAAGRTDAAIAQLDQATKINSSHLPALHMLARLQRDKGDLDAAERTLRGLLLFARRQTTDAADAIGAAEVFYELSRLARARRDEEKATELLESAMEAASQGESEARRLQRVLHAAGETTVLLRLLDARLELVQEPQQEAEVLTAKAELLSAGGDADGALKLLLQALRLDPDNEELHDAACAAARKADELGRYTDLLNTLSDEYGRKKSRRHRGVASTLSLRLGRVVEEDLGDLDRAAALYAKVEQLGVHVIESWFAIARVAGARGEREEQKRVLQHIVELPADKASDEQKREALFSLAEIELARDETRDEGVKTLERALRGAPDHPRAKEILVAQLAQPAGHPGVFDLYERVARAAHDDEMLLAWFERRTGEPDFGLDDVREGAERARRLGAPEREERLLARGAEILETLAPAERAAGVWVLSTLSDVRARAKDAPGAMRYLSRALDFADAKEAPALARKLAGIASGPGGDLDAAAKAYEKLLEGDPTDRSLWESLVEVYFRLGDKARFEAFIRRCTEQPLTPDDQLTLLLWQARYLAEVGGDERAAVEPLRAILRQSPGHAGASDQLAAIYKRHSMNDELADLWTAQLERACQGGDAETAARIALEIGALYGIRRAADSVAVYRRALEVAPKHAELLRALLKRLGRDAPARERAELGHALLESCEGLEAEKVALSLATTWDKLGEPELAIEALEMGHRSHPAGAKLGEQLEARYAAAKEWRKLAALFEADALRPGRAREAVSRLKNAAALYRDELHDLDAAASTLRKALELAPDDVSLLAELSRNLAAAGKQSEAIADVTKLLDERPAADAVRAELLRVRAELLLGVDRLADAAKDVEAAYAIAPAENAPAMLFVLERLRTDAVQRSDLRTERDVSLRLAAVHDTLGDAESSRAVLAAWVERDPRDAEALRGLCQRDTAAQRWAEVAKSSERLIEVEQGEARAAAALALADACARLGRPEASRAGLERVHAADPGSAPVRDRLRGLYESIGAHVPLASILVADAKATDDPEQRLALLQRATALYLEAGDAEAALLPLGLARELRPDDPQTELLQVDIQLHLGRIDEATKMLDAAIAAKKGRRSADLGVLQQRMSRVCAAKGDVAGQLRWLDQAIQSDRQSAEIASELANVAIQHASYDAAMKALRSLTMMDDPHPITKAMAFLKQAQIAFVRGDARRAQHWARKAKSLDEGLAEADEFLAQLGTSA